MKNSILPYVIVGAGVLFLISRKSSDEKKEDSDLILKGIPIPFIPPENPNPQPSPGNQSDTDFGTKSIPLAFFGGDYGVGAVPIYQGEVPLVWIKDNCQPIISNVDTTIAWFRNFGINAPSNLSPSRYTKYLIFNTMKDCFPPKEEYVKNWGEYKVVTLYDYFRAYLQGLISGNHLFESTVQEMLTKTRNYLISKDIDGSKLNPYVISKF